MSVPLTYYNNGSATFQINLIVYGDVEPNPGPSSDNNNELKILYLNARSVKSVTKKANKLRDFSVIMCKKIFDIIIVSESWLHNEILDAEVSHPDYILYRKD